VLSSVSLPGQYYRRCADHRLDVGADVSRRRLEPVQIKALTAGFLRCGIDGVFRDDPGPSGMTRGEFLGPAL
jgi:hypothetical protein